MTAALKGGEGSASPPGCSLTPGKTQYPFYRRLGGFQGRSGQAQKISPPLGFDPRTVRTSALHRIFLIGKHSSINTAAKAHIRKDTLYLLR